MFSVMPFLVMSWCPLELIIILFNIPFFYPSTLMMGLVCVGPILTLERASVSRDAVLAFLILLP